MGKVRLMNRIDTKFVTSLDRIEELLRRVAPGYLVQQIGGEKNMPYYTRYYDTEDVQMFYQHQRGKKGRRKIRVRRYEGGEAQSFVEIKSKNNKGRTRKKRVPMESDSSLRPHFEFLESNSEYSPSALVGQIENHFYRITLVNKDMTERVTIDTDLEFHNLQTDRRVKLANTGIIEWKRDGRGSNSEFGKILRELRIKESGFSKYCVGMAITNPDLKQNRLKEKLRMVDKLES